MLKHVFDPGGCVGCEWCYWGKDICPQCNYTVTVCDICGEETDGRDICEDCRRIEEEYEDDQQQEK